MSNQTDREAVLNVWVVFHKPTDIPDHEYVVRRWEVRDGSSAATADWTGHSTLEDARASIPVGLMLFERAPEDDPAVVESWL